MSPDAFCLLTRAHTHPVDRHFALFWPCRQVCLAFRHFNLAFRSGMHFADGLTINS